MRTYSAKKGEVERRWWVADLNDQPLGRAASEIAKVLRGKNKPEFTPHTDTGDFVVVINASKVRLTGRKLDQKLYWRHTGFVGSIKATVARDLRNDNPERMVQLAVKGMLNNNPMGRAQLRKLKVYGGSEHPHAAQKPLPLPLEKL